MAIVLPNRSTPDLQYLGAIYDTLSSTTIAEEVLSIGTAGSTGALTRFRSLTVNSTAQAIKATTGRVYSWRITNLHTAIVYVKIYNIAAASVNPASSVPIMTLPLPAGAGSFITDELMYGEYCDTAISIRCVTESGDTGTTAPGTLPIIEVNYL